MAYLALSVGPRVTAVEHTLVFDIKKYLPRTVFLKPDIIALFIQGYSAYIPICWTVSRDLQQSSERLCDGPLIYLYTKDYLH